MSSQTVSPKPMSPVVARVFVFVGAVLWSFGGLFIKEIDADAVSITFFRCLFAALWLLPLIRGRKLPHPPDMAVSIALFALLLLLYVASVKETTAANAIFLQYTAPLYIVLFAPLIIGDRIHRQDILPLAVCLGGVAVLFAGNRGSGEGLGLAMGAGSGFFYGLFFIWLRRMRYADPIAITFVACSGVAILLAAVPGVWDVSPRDIGLLVVMAAIQFALPYVLITRAIGEISSAEASLIALIEPVLAPVWVALVYGENPSLATAIGGGVIVGGLALRYAVFRGPAEARPGPGPEEVEVLHGT